MLNKTILLISLLFCLHTVKAQEKSYMKLSIEAGPILFSDSDNLSFFLNVEPKFKFSENTAIGLKIGLAINPQSFEINDVTQFFIDEENDNGLFSIAPTIDYLFNENDFRPYLGLGVGFYILSDIDVSTTARNPSNDLYVVSVNNQVGFLFRGGFELDKLRFGLEYNLVPKTDIKIPNGQVIGTAESSYLGLSFGYTFGVGKSSK